MRLRQKDMIGTGEWCFRPKGHLFGGFSTSDPRSRDIEADPNEIIKEVEVEPGIYTATFSQCQKAGRRVKWVAVKETEVEVMPNREEQVILMFPLEVRVSNGQVAGYTNPSLDQVQAAYEAKA